MIRGDRCTMARLRRHPKALRCHRPDAGLAHDACDTLLAAEAHARRTQVAMDARASVRPAPPRMDRANPRREDSMSHHPLAERLITPLLEPGLRHLKDPTHSSNVKDPFVRADEQKPHCASLAKKAVAFF